MDDFASKFGQRLGAAGVADWSELPRDESELALLLDALGVYSGDVVLLANNGSRLAGPGQHFCLHRGLPDLGATVVDSIGTVAWLGTRKGHGNLRVLVRQQG